MERQNGKIFTLRQTSISNRPQVRPGLFAVPVLSWHVKQSKYYVFSPYYLRTDGQEENKNNGNVIFENFWQGSKVFSSVYKIQQYSHYTKNGNPKYLVWQYEPSNGSNKEDHLVNNVINQEYYTWRNKVFSNNQAVRYPNGKQHRNLTRFTLLIKNDGTQERLTYVEARKRVYVKEYIRLIRQMPEYRELLDLVANGIDICILEIDVPAPNKKSYYKSLCDNQGYYEATLETLDLLLNDTSEAFGHGLCIALALLKDINHDLE